MEINPNSKIPALLDVGTAPPTTRVFESGAILLYLADKFEAFVPLQGPEQAECLSWLFWQMGSTPYLGGGFGHFYAYAPEKLEYPINRYAMDVFGTLALAGLRPYPWLMDYLRACAASGGRPPADAGAWLPWGMDDSGARRLPRHTQPTRDHQLLLDQRPDLKLRLPEQPLPRISA